MKPLQQKLNNHGYTLTEAMVVVALVAIMSGFGYSGFSSWITKEKARSEPNLLAGHLRETRIRAIEKHECHTLSYNYATNTYSAFFDTDCDQTLDTDDGDFEVIQVDAGKEFPGVVGKYIGTKPDSTLSFTFDVRGFPQQQDSILFLAKGIKPESIASLSDCVNLDSSVCCAVSVSYGDITVQCNDDY